MAYNKLMLGNCLEKMKDLPDDSVDLVLTDPPYGTTACKWDTVIPFDVMWEQLNRVTKKNGVIILFSSQPFTSALVMSNLNMFKYEWIWEKSKGCNFVHAKNMPLKFTENILVLSSASIGHAIQLGDNRMTYNPQGITKVDIKRKRRKDYQDEHHITRKSHPEERIIEFGNYPNNILKFGNSDNRERGLHPTQKPVLLMEYLIKTYTIEGETVLDFTMGSGTTGIACKNLNRNFIGIELDERYFNTAKKRIDEHTIINDLWANQESLNLFDECL
jgi:site-specific DNA-methyltransferase (adenine-specific)